MLDIRNVKVNFDRSVEPYSIDIGMQHENGIVRLDFEFDEKFNLTNEYLYFMVTDDGRTLVYPIIDNSVVIGSEITQKKRYVANIVVSKNEIIDELNKNYIVWISKDVILTITANSIITGALSPEVLPIQLQIVYDDLFDLKADLINKLESGYFKGEKGDPGEQGPKGDKGDKGDPGKDGSGAVTKENIKAALGENPLIQPSTAQIGQIFKVQSINEDGTLGLEAVDMPNCDDIEVQVSELKGDIDIYNPVDITWISGTYYDNAGNIMPNNSFSRTDFLKIYPGQKVVIKAETWNDYVGAVCFFDVNKTFVSSLSKVAEPSGKEYLFICPDGVSYFTVSKHNSNYVAMVKYSQETAATKALERENEEIDGKITDLINEINFQERDLNKKIDTKLNKVIGKNLFNGKYTTGFLNGSGNFSSVDVDYVVTDFIKVEENVAYIADEAYCSGAYHVFYDENKEIINIIGATETGNLQLVTPPSCAYVRLTLRKEKADNFMFMKGSVLEPYEPYTEFEPLEQVKKRIDSLESTKLVASPFSLKQDALNNGETMTVEVPNSKKDDSITFYSNVTSFDTLLISYGGEDNWLGGNILIEPTTIKIYRANISEAGSGIEHALSFDDFIQICIKRGGNMKTATLTIQTRTTTFSKEINWTACGGTIQVLATNSSLTNCELYYVRDDLKAETWMFGDSYFDYYLPVLANKGYSKQFMADGHTGRQSTTALKSLKLCLERAMPKRIIWAMGMNERDYTDKVSTTWYNCYNELTSICSAMGIELILVTIPQVPSSERINKWKNEIIRNSGYRYVDFSKAVGSDRDDSHTWYEGIMNSDGIHPNDLGSKFLANYLLITVPELMAEI